MENVILAIHLILALLLIGVVLLQRSEGGGLGMGGTGGVVSGRSAATALGKVTWVFAACFIATSITLTVLAARDSASSSVIDQIGGTVPAPALPETAPALPLGALPATDAPATPPASDAPATPPAQDSATAPAVPETTTTPTPVTPPTDGTTTPAPATPPADGGITTPAPATPPADGTTPAPATPADSTTPAPATPPADGATTGTTTNP